MDPRCLRLRLLLALALGLGACGDDPAPGAGAGPGGDEPEAPALALYRRELLFLPEDTAAGAAALTSQVRPASNRMLRGTHAWLARGAEWAPLLQDQWEAAPLRQPWRILPHGTLRVLVDDGGEIESLVFGRAPDAPRLNPGLLSAEWMGGAETRVLLREGELVTPAGSVPGLVLDVELGAPRLPTARMGAVLLLVDTAGAPLAAVRLPEGELRLLAFGVGEAEEGADVRLERDGAGWRLLDTEGGELGRLEATHPPPADAEAPDPHALPERPPVAVRGWVADEARRRPVRGLLFGEGG